MRTTQLLALAALALAAPAQAQSFHPEIAGPLFCELRAQGIPLSQAASVAISAAWDSRRPDTRIAWRGRIEDSDVAGMTDYTIAYCPELTGP